MMEKRSSRDDRQRGPPALTRAPPPPSLVPRSRFEPVDREKTCPLLLRVFTKVGDHHSQEEFAVRGKEPKEEVQIYTWKDATLRELTDLVKEVAPEARRRNAKLSFSFVYPDKRGRFVLKQVGMTHSYSNGRRPDDGKSLGELNFQISVWTCIIDLNFIRMFICISNLSCRLEITWTLLFCEGEGDWRLLGRCYSVKEKEVHFVLWLPYRAILGSLLVISHFFSG